MNLDILDAVQLIQHNSANKLLETLLKNNFSTKQLKNMQLRSQSILITGLNRQRKYISIDSSIDIELFIVIYTKLVFEEIYREECISMINGEIDSTRRMIADRTTIENVYKNAFTLNELKPIIWLWKMDISDEQWKRITGEIKKYVDEAFKMARKIRNRSVWKKAFSRQSTIKSIHAESEPDVILARISSSLEKMGVKLPSDSKISVSYIEGHRQFMEDLD